MRIETIYEDNDLLIVNKPSGLLVIPDRFDSNAPSLNKLVAAQLHQKIFVVHRLDRETSGVVCFAKNEETHRYLSKLFMERDVKKFYTALALGNINPASGLIDKGIAEHPVIKGKMTVTAKGKSSQTSYEVLKQWALYALVQLELHTGRTHQIRVHLQSIGNPVVCDELYGDGQPFFLSSIKKKFHLSKKEETERPLLHRLALHAQKLQFCKPDGIEITAIAPLPKDIAACVNQLDKWSK
jgi:23S rRNA pseudouridine955/2504/2580 synthase/23S rRNA pseudouridine1911/1915/1917 synthase